MNSETTAVTWRPTSTDPRHAFRERRPVGGRSSRGPATEIATPADWWQTSGVAAESDGRLAFISVPFCSSRCMFCPFYANGAPDGGGEAYVDLLTREIALDSDRIGSKKFDAVYFGAGTPSDQPTSTLARMVSAVVRALPLAPNAEVTLEGRLASLDVQKLQAVSDAGINRISIGLQSLDTRLRQRLGRRLDMQSCLHALRDLRRITEVTLVADLLVGLPGQTTEQLFQDIDHLTELGLDGLTLYVLSVAPQTPLERRVALRPEWLPSTSHSFDQYVAAGSHLGLLGWRQVSNSHWARSERERSLYNLAFKTGRPTLGFGSRAGGGREDHSYRVEPDIAKYRSRVLAGEKPIVRLLRYPHFNAMLRTLSGQMDEGRVSTSDWPIDEDVRRKTMRSLSAPLLSWAESGLLALRGDGFDLTPAGRFWEERLTRELTELLGPALSPLGDADPTGYPLTTN